MILHLVLLRFKPGTDSARIDRAGEAFLAMRGKIPEVRAVNWGPNLGPSAAEYSHILVVTVDDMAAVQRYLDHPVHRTTVAEYLGEIREARLAADLEVGREQSP